MMLSTSARLSPRRSSTTNRGEQIASFAQCRDRSVVGGAGQAQRFVVALVLERPVVLDAERRSAHGVGELLAEVPAGTGDEIGMSGEPSEPGHLPGSLGDCRSAFTEGEVLRQEA